MEPKNKSQFNRRDFLKTGALSGLFLGTAGLASCTTNGSQRSYKGRVKNIIFMVSDGMSHGTLQLADLMRRRKEGRASEWIRLYEENKLNRGLMDMTTGSSNVPDSAAAASSWGSGVRITNGSVNMMDDGTALNSVVPIFRDAGRKTGLVTTTRITHATPAGFCASVQSRGMEDEIAQQYLERQPDVLMGGGHVHFDASTRGDGRDLYTKFADTGYKIARKKADLAGIGNGFQKILGIFADHHLPYTLDHVNTPDLLENVPTLAEMTKQAIESLHASGSGFLLQVEGGRVDHAAHGMDASGLVYDQIAFDDAIEEAFKFYEAHPDETLLIITTDHGNANPGLNGVGSGYSDSVPNFDKIQTFKHTNNWVLSEFRDTVPSISQIRERIEYATGIDVSSEHADFLRRALNNERVAAYDMRNRPWATLGEIMSNYISVAFVGTSHTADYVELASAGPGSETLGPFTKNTDLFNLMLSAAGISVSEVTQV